VHTQKTNTGTTTLYTLGLEEEIEDEIIFLLQILYIFQMIDEFVLLRKQGNAIKETDQL
jgi:hypothetical protein